MFAGLGPLGALPTAPRLVRRFTTMVLAGWNLAGGPDGADLIGTAELIASELASNVVRAATTDDGHPYYDEDGNLPVLWLRLLADPGPRVQIEMWDDLPADRGIPEARAAASTDESGRGLAIIRELSHACGWNPVQGQPPGRTVKRVWAQLTA